MHPCALGYVGFGASSLQTWREYATQLLGFAVADATRNTLALRMDERQQRVIVEAGDGPPVRFLGWEVDDAAALDAIAARVEAAGIAVTRGPRALADERHVADLVALTDPLGHRVELFHGAHTAAAPFAPGRNISGFRTGALGLGHVVFNVERIDETAAFYEQVLGFRVSDFYSKPFSARFYHVNQRHHSLAFVQTGTTALHHLMLELWSFDDVGQGLDLALAEEGRLAVSLGRHCGDYMTSFYTWTPSGFMVEYGWGGRCIDPAAWTPSERTEGPSLWGHERNWLPADKRLEARAMRMRNAANGLRRPVQVLAGNHELMEGACPWVADRSPPFR
jgi:2,3-dihydroxybiphenyl 1,2-dioxygenase